MVCASLFQQVITLTPVFMSFYSSSYTTIPYKFSGRMDSLLGISTQVRIRVHCASDYLFFNHMTDGMYLLREQALHLFFWFDDDTEPRSNVARLWIAICDARQRREELQQQNLKPDTLVCQSNIHQGLVRQIRQRIESCFTSLLFGWKYLNIVKFLLSLGSQSCMISFICNFLDKKKEEI